MQLMSLNIWGGLLEVPLLAFIEQQQTVDVFCLQEVYKEAKEKFSTCDQTYSLDVFTKIQTRLPEHQGYFRPVVGKHYGLALFIKKNLSVLEENAALIYQNPDYKGRGPAHNRIIQWITYQADNKTYTCFNVHGLWNGMGKGDSTDRLAQSKHILKAVEPINGPHIICGDFNLRPDSQSLQMIAEGRQDLIASHGITSTRTSHYPKAERYADYLFASNDIQINHFSVMPDEVSDHAALWVDFV